MGLPSFFFLFSVLFLFGSCLLSCLSVFLGSLCMFFVFVFNFLFYIVQVFVIGVYLFAC